MQEAPSSGATAPISPAAPVAAGSTSYAPPRADLELATWREVRAFRDRVGDLLLRAPDGLSRAMLMGAMESLQHYYLELRASTPGGFGAEVARG